MSKAVWLGEEWTGRFDMIADFEGIYISKEDYESKSSPYPNAEIWRERKDQMSKAIMAYAGIHVLLGYYTYESYSGSAFVLFEQDGKLYTVEGGHCSCYGLEGQWDPVETTIDALRMGLERGTLGRSYGGANEFAEELAKVLDGLQKTEEA